MSTTARTHLKQGCPNCSSKKKADSFRKTILLSRIPFSDSGSPLLAEWDYERNNIQPSEITPGSKIKVWWKCKKCLNNWEESLQNRTIAGYGCPYCSDKRILQGFNDLGTKNPDLLKEWNYEKNNKLGIDPTTISPGSGLKVWWKCSSCGNEWLAAIDTRNNGRKCPLCARRNTAAKHCKSIKCIETGQIFNSVKEAAKWANINPSSLVTHLKGKVKTSGGYHWEYFQVVND